MTKKDLKFIVALLLISVVLFIGYQWFIHGRADQIEKAFVYHNNELVMEFKIDEDATYELTGDYGKMHIEVKDGKYRVYEVECPNHDCERVGWVAKGSTTTILCVPNDVFIRQDAKN
ncbi:MAG: NusG domain II-containing protein [Beduini sp.]|uniref:NusG domain II-containing protein n=1 Tax=Beduini sp. TaxID=1922300 RepID=UPI0039A382AE